MKRNILIGVITGVGLMVGSVGAAMGCGACGNKAACSDQQAVESFLKETAELRSTLQGKEADLRNEFTYDGFDGVRAAVLEKEVGEIKSRLLKAGEARGISRCCII